MQSVYIKFPIVTSTVVARISWLRISIKISNIDRYDIFIDIDIDKNCDFYRYLGLCGFSEVKGFAKWGEYKRDTTRSRYSQAKVKAAA